MTSYNSYENLERKIKKIRNDVENLCLVVNQLSDTELKIEEDISIASYHTAICGSNSTLDSFMTAMENWDDDCLEMLCEKSLSMSASQTSKKSVSFAKQITILEVVPKDGKKRKTKTKMRNIKNKFFDYIYREKFYLKYKWQKMKNNIKGNHTNHPKEIERSDDNSDTCETFSETPESKEILPIAVNLQIFFNEHTTNFVLETDIDHNSLSLIYHGCSFQQTDLCTPTSQRKAILPAEEPNKKNDITQEVVNKNKSPKTSSIEPKILKQSDESSKADTSDNDILFKYLVSKAQYPIQMKIANSIVKLNLPLWYQISLTD